MKRLIVFLGRGFARSRCASLFALLTVTMTLGSVTTARAAPFFTMTGGTSFLTAGESFLWVGPRDAGNNVLLWEGGTLGLSEPGFITLEYIGKEALYADNIFRWNGANIFTTGSSDPLIQGQTAATPFPPAALASFAVPGVVAAQPQLPFSFFITFKNTEAFNDGNLDLAFWPIPNDLSSNPYNFGTTVYAMLDDENSVDLDHDDMIVRMTVSPVPEPGTLALLCLAALPLGGWLRACRRGRGSGAVWPTSRLCPHREWFGPRNGP